MPVKELYQNTYMISLRHGLHGLFYSVSYTHLTLPTIA